MAPVDVTAAIRNTEHCISMDAPLVPGEEGNMYDVLSSEDVSNPDKELIVDSLREEIEISLNTLTLREAGIIRLFFGLNCKRTYSLAEIGEKFKLTSERVRQIKKEAIKKLKHTKRCRILKTYLG
jgi:RNA polymerase primary sigma factor